MIDTLDPAVPPEVRERITQAVWQGIAAQDERRRRAPLAVAAAVAAFLAVAVVTTLALHRGGGATPVPAARPSVPAAVPTAVPVATQELDRCWQALVHSAKQHGFPDRAQWKAVSRRETTSADVTAVRAGGKTFFCEASKTTVTVTDPAAHVSTVPGTSVRVMLADDLGFVVGTVDGAKGDVGVDFVQGNGAGVPAENGTFIVHLDAQHDLVAKIVITQGGSDPAQIPAVPAPAVTVVDRPLPPPDRSSENGERLGECLDKAGWPKAFADDWQPGAVLRRGDSYAQLAVSAGTYGLCTHLAGSGADSYRFVPMDALPTDRQPTQLGPGSAKNTSPADDWPLTLGTVPPRATAMTVETADGTHHTASVHGGTWALELAVADGSDETTITSVTVRDTHGAILYKGPIAER